MTAARARAKIPLDCDIQADEDGRITKITACGVDITHIVKSDAQFDAWFAAEIAALEALTKSTP